MKRHREGKKLERNTIQALFSLHHYRTVNVLGCCHRCASPLWRQPLVMRFRTLCLSAFSYTNKVMSSHTEQTQRNEVMDPRTPSYTHTHKDIVVTPTSSHSWFCTTSCASSFEVKGLLKSFYPGALLVCPSLPSYLQLNWSPI